MSAGWRDDPATKAQKEKLKFFGCSWKGKITKGEASDAISECVRQFPEKETEWQNRPATEEQLKLMRDVGEEIPEGLTYSQAKELIEGLETEEEITKEQKEIAYYESEVFHWKVNLLNYGEPRHARVSNRRIKEAIDHLNKTRPGWRTTYDLIAALDELESQRKTGASGCLLLAGLVASAALFIKGLLR